MDYSPILNVGTSTNGLFLITYHHSELSASSRERFTQKLEVFIYTCFSLSNRNSDLETYVYSMYSIGIQTLSLLVELQKWGMITQSRMEMWSREGLLDQNRAEAELARVVDSSVWRTFARIQMNFLSYSTKWIEEISSRVSARLACTPTGDLNQMLPSMSHPGELGSLVENLMDEMDGWRSLELDLACHY